MTDGTGHGTHVSGTIAALRDNGSGIVGVAPQSKLMALRALGDDGGGRDSDIAEAFRYAGAHGARVVNASLGGSGASHTLDAAISQYPNTLFVVSAGNGGTDDAGDDNDAAQVWPCNSPNPNVVCVGASDNRRRARGLLQLRRPDGRPVRPRREDPLGDPDAHRPGLREPALRLLRRHLAGRPARLRRRGADAAGQPAA